jgi:hypothetical protein
VLDYQHRRGTLPALDAKAQIAPERFGERLVIL